MDDRKYDLLAVIGPTASGKTAVAAHVADMLDGEVISADSRQVYRGMNLGTGKDYADYEVNGRRIPCHLIDVVDAGHEYSVYEYQRDFLGIYSDMISRKKYPVLCGGSGLYIEAALKRYRLIRVPPDDALRQELRDLDLKRLTEILKSYRPRLHNTTDIDSPLRAVRAIEIERYLQHHPEEKTGVPEINSLVVGVRFNRDAQRERITRRLKQRLDSGMAEEVTTLLDRGLRPEQLTYYGLEYKFLTRFALGELSYDEMFSGLETAIRQFAKRQMTWFRRMERQGTVIHWLDGEMPLEEKLENIRALLTGISL